MIPNHAQFIEALGEKRKVRVQYYSLADSGVLDHVCAPMDYGPGKENKDGLNRYWLWDYANDTGMQALGLLPAQIVNLQLLGEVFVPAEFSTELAPVATPASDTATIPKL